MTVNQIIITIESFGFAQHQKEKRVYSKTYAKSKYQMSIDFNRKRIDFGTEIKKGDDTTSHLGNPENIVVLECVDRLLEKGYKPSDLTLEKKWKLGRTTKSGKADITVQGKDGRTLLIIECKTWGSEYLKELTYTKNNGGQVFSYFQQDKNARYICIYASQENGGEIETAYSMIKVEDCTAEKVAQQETDKLITYQQAKTIREMLEVWKYKTKNKQNFLNSGLFETEIEPYNPGYIPLKIADLKDFGKEDKGRVFNQFEEILRHNNISDRSNAFNRIISLILAKIVDETKGEEAITDFQVKEGIDDAETLLERLQSLYSKAMRDYLDEEVIDYKLEDIEAQIANFPRQTAKDTLYRIYKELKFYQNNEFAFKEVYNKKLFEGNAKVLEEVVRLFQKYRFKYDQKAQFLGDFFELMLETGYKQSEGQFFTPTPIARFIISSIPLKTIVEEKLKKGIKHFLPKVVDFACGSGHFLTEAIEEIADLVKELSVNDIKALPETDKLDFALKELNNYKQDMRWASEYVFGLEKDYRLARTSQVACFMHGDGDANIIFGDGLEKHLGRLNKKNRSGDGTFDVLIANPPYTIKDFKKHLNVNPHDFEMWEHVTPDSDDIEVFFVERMKQLLRPGGMAGIILPSSILNNTGAYTRAREIILKHFEIKTIVEFGGSTFGATGTNTVTLFLKKRHEDFVTNCRYIAEDFVSENKKREGDFLNSKELFESYVSLLDLEMEDYKTLVARKPDKSMKATEFYKNHQTWFEGLTEVKNQKKKNSFKSLDAEEKKLKLDSLFFDMVLASETEKLFYFLLTHQIEEDAEHFGWYEDETEEGTPVKVAYPQKKAIPQKTLIVKTGRSNKEQEKFLGYKFSNRRGYKGIDFTGETLMYDRSNPLHPQKVNSYIRKNFVDEKINIDEALSETLSLVKLKDCINYEKIDFDKRINLNVESALQTVEYKWPVSTFKNVLLPINGSQTKIEKTEWKEAGDIPIISQEKEFISGYVSNVHPITDLPLIIFGDHTTIFKYIDFKFVRGADGVKLFKPTQDFIPKAFYYICQSLDIPASQKYTRHYKYLSNIKILVPPIPIQQKIIDEIENIEAREEKAGKVVGEKINFINQIIAKETDRVTVSDVAGLSKDKTNPAANPNELFNYLGLEHLEGNTGKIFHWEPSIGSSIKSTKNIFKAGQVLYGKLRPYLNKVVIPDFDGVCSTDILVLESKHPSLLQRIFLSQAFVEEASKKMSGINLPRIKVRDFLNMKINYPKNPDEVIKRLGKLEKEIANLEESITNAAVEKKAVLTKYLDR